MLGIFMAAGMSLGDGGHGIIVCPACRTSDRSFRMTGGSFDFVRQRLEPAGWRLELDDVHAAVRPNTTTIFLNSPATPPDGSCRARSRSSPRLLRERGIVIIADEVYHRNVFEGEVAPSFLTVAAPDDPVIVINGFSKAYAMTGWRLGWVVVPAATRSR